MAEVFVIIAVFALIVFGAGALIVRALNIRVLKNIKGFFVGMATAGIPGIVLWVGLMGYDMSKNGGGGMDAFVVFMFLCLCGGAASLIAGGIGGIYGAALNRKHL